MRYLLPTNSCLGVLDINGSSKAYPAWTFAVHQQSKRTTAAHNDDSSDYASEQSNADCSDNRYHYCYCFLTTVSTAATSDAGTAVLTVKHQQPPK
jgi:hypothetical protein